mmetsp:Transcript_34369/g.83417  ORF Transcript_34369/g.83417 Transcript_34369/m.83417 type:complete len:1109 (-) Transcript_34369:5312-8638(-)
MLLSKAREKPSFGSARGATTSVNFSRHQKGNTLKAIVVNPVHTLGEFDFNKLHNIMKAALTLTTGLLAASMANASHQPPRENLKMLLSKARRLDDNGNNNNNNNKRKSKRLRKKKKKDPLSQSAHAPSKTTLSKEDSLIGSDIQFSADSPLENNDSNSNNNDNKKQGRRNSLLKTHSVPNFSGYGSDGDSTMEGSWEGGHESFLTNDEDPPRGGGGGKKSKVPSEIEAFLDQIIIDARVPTGPIESIRTKARGRSRNSSRVKKDEIELVFPLNDEKTTSVERRKTENNLIAGLDGAGLFAIPKRQRCNSADGPPKKPTSSRSPTRPKKPRSSLMALLAADESSASRASSRSPPRPKKQRSLMALLDESNRSRASTISKRAKSFMSESSSATRGTTSSRLDVGAAGAGGYGFLDKVLERPTTVARSTSDDNQSNNNHGVVSLKIEGEEKKFTLSENDLGVIEAYLETKAKEPTTKTSLSPMRSSSITRNPMRSSSTTRKPMKRSTSATRAAKRQELFDDPLLKSDRSSASAADMMMMMNMALPSATATAARRSGKKDDLLLQSDRDDQMLLHSERIDHHHGHHEASRLSKLKDGNTSLSNLQSFNEIKRLSISSDSQRMSMTGAMVSSRRPRSLSAERKMIDWQDMHESRLAALELETITDEGSYSLSRSTPRRWSLSDSMSLSMSMSRRRLSMDSSMCSMSSHHRLQQFKEEKKKKQLPVENRFHKRDSFNRGRVPRRGRKAAGASPEDPLARRRDSIDGEGGDLTKQRLSSKERKKAKKDESPEQPERLKRRSRSRGRKMPKHPGKDILKTWSGDKDEQGHDGITKSPGAEHLRKEKLMRSEDEASHLEVSCRGQTLEQLMSMPAQHHQSKPDTYEPLTGGDGQTTPRQKQRVSRKSPVRGSTPNGEKIYQLDLGEARWTTTPTTRLKGQRSKVDPLDLQLPFESEDYGSRPTGILKTSKLGLVEPAAIRNRVSAKKKKKKKGVEEGDVLVCDDDNATVVSDITEAIFDSSLRSTMSTSMRSNPPNHADDFEESLRNKWEPKIENIAETNSQADPLHASNGDFSAGTAPSLLKSLGPEASPPTTPGGSSRFSWMKKLPSSLPFSKKK